MQTKKRPFGSVASHSEFSIAHMLRVQTHTTGIRRALCSTFTCAERMHSQGAALSHHAATNEFTANSTVTVSAVHLRLHFTNCTPTSSSSLPCIPELGHTIIIIFAAMSYFNYAFWYLYILCWSTSVLFL
jgi:hypothetical protein